MAGKLSKRPEENQSNLADPGCGANLEGVLLKQFMVGRVATG